MGHDVSFDLGRIDGYAKFCNKLWQASRFVLMNTEELDRNDAGNTTHTLADRWICSCLARTITEVNENIEAYRFDRAARTQGVSGERLGTADRHTFSERSHRRPKTEPKENPTAGDTEPAQSHQPTVQAVDRTLDVGIGAMHLQDPQREAEQRHEQQHRPTQSDRHRLRLNENKRSTSKTRHSFEMKVPVDGTRGALLDLCV